MKFLKRFLLNLALLFVIGIVLFITAPAIMGQVFQLFSGLFGPVVLLLLILAAAMPSRRRSRRSRY